MFYRCNITAVPGLFAAVMLMALAGCGSQSGRQMPVCIGVRSADEAASLLRLQSCSTNSLKAGGHCELEYYTQGKKRREDFLFKMWLQLPDKIYIQGQIALDPQAVAAGSNGQDFWLTLRTKEISGYWWGQWSGGSRQDGLFLSPALVLEFFGAAETAAGQDWTLSAAGAFDVLTKNSTDGMAAVRMHIYNCDHLVRKIEHFDPNGNISAAAESDGYMKLPGGCSVPSVIKVIRYISGTEQTAAVAAFKFDFIKPTDFTQEQAKRLFDRPSTTGFKHVRKMSNAGQVELP